MHRTRHLHPADVRRRHRPRLTAPARTLLDLAEVVDEFELERAIAEARVKRLLTKTQLRELMDRSSGRHGLKPLRNILAREHGPALTKSVAERRTLDLIRAAKLPEPEVNVRVCGFVVDYLWREARLIAEVDGYRLHSGRRSFERDHERDGALGAQGYTVERITWTQLTERPQVVIARIALALGRARALH